MRLPGLIYIGAGLAALAAAGAACIVPPKPESNWTIEDARQFGEFQLYWLGENYEGLPLTLIEHNADPRGLEHASFWYGEPSLGGDSPSWQPALEITMFPYCQRPLTEFVSYQEGNYAVDVSSIQIRGVDGRLRRHSWKNPPLSYGPSSYGRAPLPYTSTLGKQTLMSNRQPET